MFFLAPSSPAHSLSFFDPALLLDKTGGTLVTIRGSDFGESEDDILGTLCSLTLFIDATYFVQNDYFIPRVSDEL